MLRVIWALRVGYSPWAAFRVIYRGRGRVVGSGGGVEWYSCRVRGRGGVGERIPYGYISIFDI